VKKPVTKKKQEVAEGVNTLFGRVAIKKDVEVVVRDITPFDFVNDISFDKNYLYEGNAAKNFKPFLINKALSAFPDCLQAAVFLNANHALSEKMQHDYLFYSLPKRKRFNRNGWLKKSEAEKRELALIEDVAKTVGYNIERTKQFWAVLTETQRREFLDTYVYPDQKNARNK
jgi:hypothetical protein